VAHPTGARLALAAYATPLLSTGLLLATGQRLSPLGLLGCGLIVLCATGVVLDALPRRDRRARRASAQAGPACRSGPRRAHLLETER